MKPKPLISTALALLAFACEALARDQQPSEAEKISQGLTEAYTAAFDKGDAKGLAALYAEDAQFTSDAGNAIIGRAAMLEHLAKYFVTNRGAKLKVQVESARFLTPNVLLEKGFATVDDKTTRYVCSYVKKDGSWLISELDETTLPPVDAAAAALGDLGWLVGSWKDNAPGVAVTSTVDWTNNHHFLRRSVAITRDGGDQTVATEVIGYDPVAGGLRSWMFDSDGGFGEGKWTREGNKWMNSFAATSPDGATSSAQHIITYVDDKKYTWESVNRQRDGEVLPNLDKIEVVRTTE
ncbi:MAG TPA: SgcJ/EcaC family oxidoreductase [Terrimicrobiaceae bacterium]